MSVFVESVLLGVWVVVRFILICTLILLVCGSPIILIFAITGISAAWTNGYGWAVIGGAVLFLALLGYIYPRVA